MLDSISKSMDNKSSQKEAEVYVQKGLTNLSGRMYQQAMINFQNAYEADAAYAGKVLNTEFNNFYSTGDYEGALSIGLTLIKSRPNDYELANILGNCARKDENFKQSNNLYRHALKIKPSYQMAFYNLAASMGKVQKYDEEVLNMIKKFGQMTNYILPDFLEDPKIDVYYKKQIEEIKEQQKALKIKEYQDLLAKLDEEDRVLESRKVKADLKQTEMQKTFAKNDEILEYFKNHVTKLKEATEDEEKRKIPLALFDLALYAITIRDGDLAHDTLDEVRHLGMENEHLEMVWAISRFMIGEKADALDTMTKLLGREPTNRFLNINMGLMYKEEGNRLLSYKYLITGASLLEKSEGLYKLSDLIRLAEESFEAGNNKRSLALYEVIAEEITTVDPWLAMGEIYLKSDKLEESAAKFRKALEIAPGNKTAKEKMKEIHDIYYERGEAFFRETKYKAATGIFEKAMGILRLPETVKRCAGVYKLMKNAAKYESLMEEYEILKEAEKALEQEKLRQGYIVKGRAYMARKHWHKAIEQFELAFRMKLDKDVFMFLATLYKNLHMRPEMEDLLGRWNKMVEYEDRMKKFKKEEAQKRRSFTTKEE